MPALSRKTRLALISLLLLGTQQDFSTKVEAKTPFKPVQESEEENRRPASARTISVATADFQKAVNGKALVRNHCRIQGKQIEVQESAEVLERDQCKIVLKTKKTTHAENSSKDAAEFDEATEFTVYANLSDLTTPVLTETQRFAQCDAEGTAVLKVSSRSDPKRPVQVVRRSLAATKEESKQTRRDMSLFFADPKAAKRAAEALDRAVKACGGKEWPDEDDLP